MNEQRLLDYFENKADVQLLCEELTRSRIGIGHVFSLDLDVLNLSTPFTVNRIHSIRLCIEVISEQLSFENPNTIAFIVKFSSSFVTDPADNRSEQFFDDWSEGKAGYVWSKANMYKWINFLEKGTDDFDENDLKKVVGK